MSDLFDDLFRAMAEDDAGDLASGEEGPTRCGVQLGDCLEVVTRGCPVCGQIYSANPKRLKYGRQTTCSRSCSYKMRAEKLRNSEDLTCAVCSVVFTRCVTKVKGKYGSQFCSKTCHYKGRTMGKSKRIVVRPYVITEAAIAAWRMGIKKSRATRIARDNYKHTEATKAKLRDASCRAIAENRIKTTSNLELRVAPVLDALGIAYTHQYPVRGVDGRFVCVFDFFLPEYNTVVEVNGTFWHADPRSYPNGPIHAIQRRCAMKWEDKLARIRELGYRLVVLWEDDIRKHGEDHMRRTIEDSIR